VPNLYQKPGDFFGIFEGQWQDKAALTAGRKSMKFRQESIKTQ
jgi:hypothetical protein